MGVLHMNVMINHCNILHICIRVYTNNDSKRRPSAYFSENIIKSIYNTIIVIRWVGQISTHIVICKYFIMIDKIL